MALELRQDGELTWVTDAELVPDGDAGTRYQIRHVTIEKNRELLKLCTTRKPNRRTGQMDEHTDYAKLNDEQFDYALAEWEGVEAGGEPLKCVWQNKKLLDGQRRDAILIRAGLNEIASAPERREESFRPAPDLR